MVTTSRERNVPPPSYDAAFTFADWGLLAATALMWGSSFVWIEEALEAFEPGLIAFVRILFGAATLALFPQSRAAVARADIKPMAVLGLIWMAVPFLLFPIAQQWIDSSLAGMLNGSVPIFAALVGVVISRRGPAPRQVLGLVIGLGGVVAVTSPYIGGTEAKALGVACVLLASLLYGVALHIAAPLQQRYGALPVILRTQCFALAYTAVPALFSIPGSSFKLTSGLSLIPLGALGTGLAFVCMFTLVGRVGPGRGSVTIYFVPVVAVIFGALLRSESPKLISLVGTALVIAGAVLAARPASPQQGEPLRD
jgi:drug/metabolite transporter (DMT)-like permease